MSVQKYIFFNITAQKKFFFKKSVHIKKKCIFAAELMI